MAGTQSSAQSLLRLAGAKGRKMLPRTPTTLLATAEVAVAEQRWTALRPLRVRGFLVKALLAAQRRTMVALVAAVKVALAATNQQHKSAAAAAQEPRVALLALL